ncbi:MAG: FG-GAP repeat protein [Xanthomonadales bacterium]|nr:FG-GAP repeat protein [Xanthomonadales bacterium]
MSMAGAPVLAKGIQTELHEDQQISSYKGPEGLTQKEWGSIKKLLKNKQYGSFKQVDGSYTSSNIANGWQIKYGTDGHTVLTPYGSQESQYYIGLKLKSLGYAKQTRYENPERLTASEQELSYHWDDNVKEIWTNSADKLEQWFEIQQQPQGELAGHQLVLQLALSTNLEVIQSGDALSFSDKISYDKLKVWDSKGVIMPASMQLQNNMIALVIDDSLAQYPLTIDPSFQQQAYLKSSNSESGDLFGWSADISGDTLVVGAHGEDSSATGVNGDESNNLAEASGAVYIFIRTASGWQQQAYIKASNTDSNDQFGRSVAISGDTVVIGAFNEDSNATGVDGDQANNAAAVSGAAYIFTRTGTSWEQQAYLKASNTGADDWFAYQVDISGDTVVVSSQREDSNSTGINSSPNNFSTNSGAAYVFTRNGAGEWDQQAYLKASNTGNFDGFGGSIAISNDTIVVGARAEGSNSIGIDGDQSNNLATESGAAYIFTRSGESWTQQAYLKASNTDARDHFGNPVAIADDTVVIGALNEDSNAVGIDGDQTDNSANSAGAAYVFTRSGTAWEQQAYLKASNTGDGDLFSSGIGVSGNTIIMGAQREGSSATGIDGDETDDSSGSAGAAYVYTRIEGVWGQHAYLKASNTGGGDEFGSNVTISGNTVLVGAAREDSNATGVDGDGNNNLARTSGAVYVFGDLITTDYSVGGTVAGLTAGNSATLQNNASDDLSILSNGSFTFNAPIADGDPFVVTASVQPTNPNQICTVTGGNSGNNDGAGIIAGAAITNIVVTCRGESIFSNSFE